MLLAFVIAVALGVTVLGDSSSVDCGHHCCLCGHKTRVKLRVENNLVTPYFNYTAKIEMRQRQLIYFLQSAAERQEEFGFSADYGKYGYFINTINELRANYTADETWWKITNGNNVTLKEGVSSYIPKDHETIIFSFVQG